RGSDIPSAALNQAEYAGMEVAGPDCGINGFRHYFAGARMGGMALDHDRASGGQCGSRVAARSRECQREVRGTEDRHRTDRSLQQPDIGTRHGLAVLQGAIMAAVEIVALADMICEQAQLAHGAAAFA